MLWQTDPNAFLRQLFQAATTAAHPDFALPSILAKLAPRPGKRTIVVGAGKASAAMACAFEANWPHPIEAGLVVTRYGQKLPCPRIEIIEAAHPVPDAASQQAAQRMLAMVQGLTADDLVVALISGGGSSLLALPAPGINLADKQAIGRALLASGAAIGEINCVRKHLSAIKGGQLALAAYPARVLTLAISDIPGDQIDQIASGPTLPDPDTREQAQAILARYQIAVPDQVARHLAQFETPKPGDVRLGGHTRRHSENGDDSIGNSIENSSGDHSSGHIIASAQQALQAAAALAQSHGITPYILSDCIEGEARAIGQMHAAMVQQIVRHNQPFARPCLLLSGGETSVTVRGTGQGGRNSEFLLALAIALQGQEGVYALAADTDGIDGSQTNAGALASPTSLARARALGLNPVKLLENNDSFQFFERLGDLLITGPTHTNVNDLRAILIQ
jgi:hydroxypyruvate reductase